MTEPTGKAQQIFQAILTEVDECLQYASNLSATVQMQIPDLTLLSRIANATIPAPTENEIKAGAQRITIDDLRQLRKAITTKLTSNTDTSPSAPQRNAHITPFNENTTAPASQSRAYTPKLGRPLFLEPKWLN